MADRIADIAAKALQNRQVDRAEAEYLATRTGQARQAVLYWAGRIRHRFCGDRVRSCTVMSARQGRCSEDCAFCSQSVHHACDIEEFPLVDEQRIAEAARAAGEAGADGFGIVTSGRTIGHTETERAALCRAIRSVSKLPVRICASLGQLGADEIKMLKAAGLRRLHHNLETSRRFFPRICSTHTFDQRVETIRLAKAAGLQVCSGGLFGLGEDWDDRVDLALTLRELDVNAVPINFLNPRPRTPLADRPMLPPLECLHIIALFRFVLPDREIKVCGGREACLRDLQSWIFAAGANGLMVGNYLTTAGRDPARDLQMLRDLEMSLRNE